MGGRILSSGSYGWSELGGWIPWNYYHPLDTLALIAEIFLTTSLLWVCRRPGREPTTFPSGEAAGSLAPLNARPHLLRHRMGRKESSSNGGRIFRHALPLICEKHNVKFGYKVLEDIFKVTGYPERLRSDNGRQFVSEETLEYLQFRGIQQETSSPEFPSSNGHAEAAVKSIKKLLKKSKTNEEFEASLAELNRQPRSNNEIPADIFFRIRVRGNLWRKISDPNEVIYKKKKSETSAKTEHELPRLELGQLVRIQNSNKKYGKKRQR